MASLAKIALFRRSRRALKNYTGTVWQLRETVWVHCLKMDSLMKRQRTRQQLLKLDETQLRDVGISHSQQTVEGSKRIWQD